MNVFQKIGGFFSCLLQENCKYSIKKILAYIFSVLVVYLVVFTDKEYYEILIFVGALLGIRGYERVKLWGGNPSTPPTDDPEPADGLSDGSPLGATKKNKRLLTD